MIQCPNCGSTAQVRERSIVDMYDEEGKHTRVVHCDCGCGKDFFYKEEDE